MSMDVGIEDLITSFSNPNYGLGCSELRVHEPTGEAASSRSVERPEELGACAGAEQIIDTWRRESPSSGDSAISSPMTDSCLASPLCETLSNKPSKTLTSGADVPQFDSHTDGVGSLRNKQAEGKTGAVDDKVGNITSTGAIGLDTDCSQGSRLILPAGWKQCDDADGLYYWHVKSGTLQRDPPDGSRYEKIAISNGSDTSSNRDSRSTELESLLRPQGISEPDVVPTNQNLLRQARAEADNTDESTPALNGEYPIRYAVRSLGWVEIAEQELTQERSSRAVNKAIVDLSGGSGRRDFSDAVGRWGDGKYLYMDVDLENLSLISPNDLTVLNVQPIRTIRVWGVGRDNGRDFAYVARDRISRRYMCHVFRCEKPARNIASTLCEICKRAVARASKKLDQGGASSDSSLLRIVGRNHEGAARPADLPNLVSANRSQEDLESEGSWQKEASIKYEALLKNSAFPTPMDEPRKLMNCRYLGLINVSMPTGIETLNGAIDMLYARMPAEKWIYVDVTIAPSTIIIANHESPDDALAECRVRFLSFLGISVKNIRLCAFIMHTAQDKFDAHVFYCEPSAGAFCKTIEAACKLRYQKCLDKSFSGSTLTSPADANSDTESMSSSKEAEQNESNAITSRTALLARADSLRNGMARVHSAARASLNTDSMLNGLTALKSNLSAHASDLKVSTTSALKSAAGTMGEMGGGLWGAMRDRMKRWESQGGGGEEMEGGRYEADSYESVGVDSRGILPGGVLVRTRTRKWSADDDDEDGLR